MKTYILKKDTPKSKAGEKVSQFDSEVYVSQSGEGFRKETVENNPEWFEREDINEQIEELIDILQKFKKYFSDIQYESNLDKELSMSQFVHDREINIKIRLK